MRVRDPAAPSSRVAFAFAIALALVAATSPARLRADEPIVTPTSSVPLFAIRKSENRNQVQYAVRLDAACRPHGDEPVVAYWRLLERGPSARASLELFEQRAYGIARQRTSADATGARVDLVLRALRGRAIVVRVQGAGGRCTARATTMLQGVECTIDDVYVALSGPVSVDYVEIRGHAVVGGAERVEREVR